MTAPSSFALTAGLLLLSASSNPSCHAFHHSAPSTVTRVSSAQHDVTTALSSTAAAADVSIITNSAVVGDADRSLRQGMQYEKFGLFRAAAESFHEAATLYQCFLDQIDRDAVADANGDNGNPRSATTASTTATTSITNGANAFGHVTGLNPEGPNSCLPVLAYACIRLAHLSHDALGDSKAAARLYKEAGSIDPMPSSVAYDGIGTSMEASGGSLLDAVEAYREAYRLNPSSAQALFHLAVALERVGQVEESEPMMERLRRSEAKVSCLVDSWGYVRWHTRKEVSANLHRGTRTLLQIGLNAAMSMIKRENGLVCDFGVFNGRSTRMMQEILPLGTEIHGFDTFTGIPQAWGDEPAGSYSTGGVIPNIEGKVYFHKGLFKDTIPVFLDSLKTDNDDDYYEPLAFANVDCDLYGSTLDVLERMHSRIVPGTVLVFDEYLCHPTWRQDEFRAWRECCKRFGWQYRYLGFSLSTKQAVVQVTA